MLGKELSIIQSKPNDKMYLRINLLITSIEYTYVVFYVSLQSGHFLVFQLLNGSPFPTKHTKLIQLTFNTLSNK